MQGKEAMERARFLVTDSGRMWYDMHGRQTEPEDTKMHFVSRRGKENFILMVSK